MSSPGSAALSRLPGKYLTFVLDGTCYGFGIHDIREIIVPLDVARVPRAQAWIRGVINLRGKIIPVMDLRARFQLDPAETTDQTVVIVVQKQFQDGESIFGIQVDQVLEVLSLKPDQIALPPDLGGGGDEGTRCMLATARSGERVIFLLNLDRIVMDVPASTPRS
jgi:purine-binding chemotaxis protein CheW